MDGVPGDDWRTREPPADTTDNALDYEWSRGIKGWCAEVAWNRLIDGRCPYCNLVLAGDNYTKEDYENVFEHAVTCDPLYLDVSRRVREILERGIE